jgi:long-chain acyl-CoA synthetase
MTHRWLKYYDEHVPHNLDYPRIPLYQILDDTAAEKADSNCCCFFGKWMTYGQLQDATNRFAAAAGKLGIKKGDRVALLLPTSPQFIIAYYGLMKAGAIVLPLNPLYTARELSFHFDDSGAETVITIPMFLDKMTEVAESTPLKRIIYSKLGDFMPLPLGPIQGLREALLIRKAKSDVAEIINMNELLKTPAPNFKPVDIDPDEMAALLYSGGTTGIAKGIMLSHYSLVVNAKQAVTWGNLDSGHERLLAVLPLFHGFGMSINMNAVIMGGGEVVLLPKFSTKNVVQTIDKYKPTFFLGVPTMFVAFSNLPGLEKYDFSSLNGIFVGAAPLTQAIKDDFEGKTGGSMIEGYGLTEAVTGIMANPYQGMQKLGSIGIPFPDMEAKIVGIEDGKDLPPGETGEIILKGPTLMLGYFNMPDITAETIKDGWLYTGDIGYMDEDGYFYITDRKKELIITGGFNVFPREIDEMIYRHPKVMEGICVGLPHDFKGEKIKVYIVLKEGETATEEELISFFKENLAPYKVPSEVEFRTELPKSAVGKILRRALVEGENKSG